MWRHFNGRKVAVKVLQCGFYGLALFMDAFEYCKSFIQCQLFGRNSRRDMMLLNPIIVVEIFVVWGVDFMVLFLSSCGNEYILLTMDYVSKWIEGINTRTNDAKVVAKFFRENIFTIFGMPRATISDQGTHFANRSFDTLLKKYSIGHRLTTPSHPRPMAILKFLIVD